MDKLHKSMSQYERSKKYYTKSDIKQYKFNLKPHERAIIDTLMAKTGKTKKDTVLLACKYCIDNNITFDD